MTYYCDIVDEYGEVSSGLTHTVFSATLEDVASYSEATLSLISVEGDTVQCQSGVAEARGYVDGSAADALSAVHQTVHTSNTLGSETGFDSGMLIRFGNIAEEAGTLDDAATSRTSTRIAEVVTVESLATHTGRLSTVVGEETVSLSGVPSGASIVVGDTTLAQSAALATRYTQDLVTEVASLQSGSSSEMQVGEVVGSEADATSGVSARLLGVNIANEVGYFESGAVLPSVGAARTANLDSFGGSRFSDYPFVSMAVVDGVPCGITRDALFRLDQKLDVESSVLTDKLGFGSMQQKRISGVYLTGSCAGSASVEVAVEDDTSYEYPFETASTDGDKHTFRAQTGKGLRGSYWQIHIKSSGTGFVINSAAVDAAVSTRRV